MWPVRPALTRYFSSRFQVMTVPAQGKLHAVAERAKLSVKCSRPIGPKEQRCTPLSAVQPLPMPIWLSSMGTKKQEGGGATRCRMVTRQVRTFGPMLLLTRDLGVWLCLASRVHNRNLAAQQFISMSRISVRRIGHLAEISVQDQRSPRKGSRAYTSKTLSSVSLHQSWP